MERKRIITTIIFSFDRALQLEILLKSAVKYDVDKQLDIHILYSFSNSNFELGYEKLIKKFPKFNWHKETRFSRRIVKPIFPFYWRNYYWWIKHKYNRWIASDFKSKIISIFNNSRNDLIMFLTDDSMFIDEIEIEAKISSKIVKMGHLYSYSLRHGKNIIGGNYTVKNSIVCWNRTHKQGHSEWSYPFSVDGHIYNKNILKEVFYKVTFKNPNTLEGNVACYVKEKQLFKKVIANSSSCLLGFELNCVQSVSENNNLNISNTSLNSLYLKGFQLKLNYSLPRIHFFRPIINSVSAIKEDVSILLYEKK